MLFIIMEATHSILVRQLREIAKKAFNIPLHNTHCGYPEYHKLNAISKQIRKHRVTEVSNSVRKMKVIDTQITQISVVSILSLEHIQTQKSSYKEEHISQSAIPKVKSKATNEWWNTERKTRSGLPYRTASIPQAMTSISDKAHRFNA